MLHISWLIDLPKEKHIGFSMTVSLSYVTTHPLLQDRRVFITPNVEPDREMTENLIKAVHAQLGYGSTALELLSRWAHYTNLKYLMEKIVSTLNLKTSSAVLETYCLMWSLHSFVNSFRHCP